MENIKLPTPKTIFEPFRIKSVEPLPLPNIEQRRGFLKEASYNLFTIPARAVSFDMLTDSGTSAMSAKQWGRLMEGDESYAGSDSYYRFAEAIQDLTGLEHVIPTHQGRSAEALLARALIKPEMIVAGNTHFDTTRANIESSGAEAIDLPCEETKDSQKEFDFKGNMDLVALEKALESNASKMPFVIMTITNNSVGGQPVSMANIKATKKILSKYNTPLFLDAARFAENSYFIKTKENGFSDRTVESIAKEMFSYADGVLMSAKKDAFANIGGFLAVKDSSLAEEVRGLMVITEGFPTYGGLTGRDMEVLAVGLKEILDEDYLKYRLKSVSYFGKGIESTGLKVVKPFGGHAVYIDAGASLPHLKPSAFPAQSLSVALYEYIGLRSVEVGSVMLGRRDEQSGEEIPAPHELVRIAMPRRVYTQSHIDYILETLAHIAPHATKFPGYKITQQNKFLRHFTAKFEKIN